MSNFPSKIKKLRIENGLTQKQIAESLNVSQNAIYNWENGKREPNLDMIKQIAKYFDFPLYLLLDDNYELGDIELEMKRARPFKSYEMVEPPGPFTVPLSQYNNGNNIYKNLHEIVLQSELNRETSTDGKEQASIGIPVRSRKRANAEDTNYDPLSYENSYSFASSEEEYEDFLKQRQKRSEDLLLADYRKLNDTGKAEARKRVNELTEIPRYATSPEPPEE